MTRLLKTLIIPTIIALPLAVACTESHHQSTRRNLDGSETTREIEVRRNPITGNTTVEQTEARH